MEEEQLRLKKALREAAARKPQDEEELLLLRAMLRRAKNCRTWRC